MIDLVHTVGPELGTVAACAALGLARATYCRQLEPAMLGPFRRRVLPADSRPPTKRRNGCASIRAFGRGDSGGVAESSVHL